MGNKKFTTENTERTEKKRENQTTESYFYLLRVLRSLIPIISNQGESKLQQTN